MGLVILGLISIVLSCLILGYPYTLLLSTPGFWIAMGITIALFIICYLVLGASSKKSTLIWKILDVVCLIVCIAIPITLIAACFIPSFATSALSLIGMRDHLSDFHDISISTWRYIAYIVVELILFGLYGATKGSDKPTEKTDDANQKS